MNRKCDHIALKFMGGGGVGGPERTLSELVMVKSSKGVQLQEKRTCSSPRYREPELQIPRDPDVPTRLGDPQRVGGFTVFQIPDMQVESCSVDSETSKS